METKGKLMRWEALKDKLGGLGRTTIYRMEKEGKFPKRIKISRNVVAWQEDQVNEWIQRSAKNSK